MRPQVICVLAFFTFVSCVAYAGDYQTVRIVAPEAETTIHDNNGNLAVTVEIAPPLTAGDQLVLLLDRKEVAGGVEQYFELKDIDRGSHTLRARVKAPDGKVLATSRPVKFYMWRASRLFRGRER